MIDDQTYQGTNEFSTSGTKVEPDSGKRVTGMAENEGLPFEYFNYYINLLTKNNELFKASLESLLAELKTILTDQGITPDPGKIDQILTALELKFPDFEYVHFKEITDNTNLEVNRKYIATGEYKELTLPDPANIGDTITVFSEKLNKIIQSDPEHLIIYFNAYSTSKGVDGYLSLQQKCYIELIYRGASEFVSYPGTKVTDPAILPAGYGESIAFSSDATYLAVGHANSPFITIYKRTGDVFTKLTDPATIPGGVGYCCEFSSDDVYLVVGAGSDPRLLIYKRSGDTFTKLPDPTTMPAGTVYACSFSFDNIYLAITSADLHLTIYKRSGDTFTKLPDPATMPAGLNYGCSFSHDGIYLAVTQHNSPYIFIYKRSGDTFTKLPDPTDLPPDSPHSCSFSSDGSYLAIGHASSPFITIYKRNGDEFTKLEDPADLPPDEGNGISFIPNGNYLAVATIAYPYCMIYERFGDLFVKLSDPAIVPTGYGRGCNFSSNWHYLAFAHYTTPFVTIYKANIVSGNKTWYLKELNTLYDGDKKYLFK